MFGKGDTYLAPNPEGDEDNRIHTNRVTQLGRHLLECQGIGNFEAMREGHRLAPFAGVAHEVRCAAVALRTGHDVQFVERTGALGRDFDFLIDGRVALEVKCKEDGTP